MLPYQIKGQCVAKRAFEIGWAGREDKIGILLIGPLGSSKTTIREAFPNVRSEEREPCLCGHYLDVRQSCKCKPEQLLRWHRRLERLTRGFEIVLEAVPVTTKEMMSANQNTTADDDHLLKRVRTAISFGYLNKSVELTDDAASRTVEMATRRIGLTYGQYEGMLRVARIIANLDASEKLKAKHIAEAVQYSASCMMRTLTHDS